jgi:hypothetical protein
MGDQLCLGDKLCEHILCSPFLLLLLVWLCVGSYGDVLERLASSEAGFDGLKFKELGLIHRLFWVCLPWWVMTDRMPVITSHNSPTNWSKRVFRK